MEPKIERGAAPDIHRIEDASVNWYLVEAADGLTIVDAGVPRSWERTRTELGIPVYVHENDTPLARKPLQFTHERARSRYKGRRAQLGAS
ncbi:MAG TPA: hypothetical protein VD761_04735 [Solirubrobacterales bacterium]|nr:hypothetical protein [Solirubrobacterales bacterium]